jgi:hypothetical protein
LNNTRTAVIVISGLVVGIVAGVLAGQWVFGAVFEILHPDTNDFWQNLVTLAIAAFLTLVAGGLAFGTVMAIFYGTVYGFSKKRHRINGTTRHD